MTKKFFKNSESSGVSNRSMKNSLAQGYALPSRNEGFRLKKAIYSAFIFGIFYGVGVYLIGVYYEVSKEELIIYTATYMLFGAITAMVTEFLNMGFMFERLATIIFIVGIFLLLRWAA